MPIEFDLCGIAGQALRLKAASVINGGSLFSSVDEVTRIATLASGISTLSTL